MRIDVAIVDTVPLGVDTPADLESAPADLPNRAADTSAMTKTSLKIAFQGEPGANSHIASARLSRR